MCIRDSNGTMGSNPILSATRPQNRLTKSFFSQNQSHLLLHSHIQLDYANLMDDLGNVTNLREDSVDYSTAV